MEQNMCKVHLKNENTMQSKKQFVVNVYFIFIQFYSKIICFNQLFIAIFFMCKISMCYV